MDRRTALKNASLLLGYTLSAPTIMAIMQGCQPEVVPGFEPAFFAKEELGTVKAFMDTIIPKTDTPSASEVGIIEFMDNMFAVVSDPKEQEMIRNGFKELAKLSGDASFASKSEEERSTILQQMEKSALASEAPTEENFWLVTKGFIVNGYMLSEKIGTEYLAYDPVPGEYLACADLSISNGKNWSLR